MKKIFQKSLALAVSAALCLTAFVGVSATEPDATAEISDVVVASDATSAEVTVNLAGISNTIAAARFDVVADEDVVTIGDVDDDELDDQVGVYKIDVDTYRVLVNVGGNNLETAETVSFVLPCTILDNSADIAIAFGDVKEIAYAGTLENGEWTGSEGLFANVTWENGSIAFEAAHQHDFSGAWVTDTQNHWKVCPEDQEIGESAPHTWNEGEVTTAATHTAAGVRTYTCTVCGATKTEEIGILNHTYSEAWTYDETNHWHVCTANDGATDGTAAHEFETSTEGYITTYTCSVCGYSYEEDNTPAEPEVTVDNNIVFPASAVGLAATSVQYTIRVQKKLLNNYADFDLVFVPDHYDSQFNLVEDPTEVVVNKSAMGTGTFYQYAYTDIQLYELGCNIQYYVKCYNAQGEYIARSPFNTVSPADQLKGLLNNNNTNAALRTAIADLLIAGDEAAKLFAPENSGLANATSILEGAYISPATESVSLEDLSVVNDYSATNSAFTFGATSAGAHRLMTTVEILKVPVLNFRLRNPSADRLDTDKLSMTISYVSTTSSEYSRTFTGSDWQASGTWLSLAFGEIGLHDASVPLQVVATYDGNEVFNMSYSMHAYYADNMNDPTIGALVTALAKVSISFPEIIT